MGPLCSARCPPGVRGAEQLSVIPANASSVGVNPSSCNVVAFGNNDWKAWRSWGLSRIWNSSRGASRRWARVLCLVMWTISNERYAYHPTKEKQPKINKLTITNAAMRPGDTSITIFKKIECENKVSVFFFYFRIPSKLVFVAVAGGLCKHPCAMLPP